jgi:hypothetical protein
MNSNNCMHDVGSSCPKCNLKKLDAASIVSCFGDALTRIAGFIAPVKTRGRINDVEDLVNFMFCDYVARCSVYDAAEYYKLHVINLIEEAHQRTDNLVVGLVAQNSLSLQVAHNYPNVDHTNWDILHVINVPTITNRLPNWDDTYQVVVPHRCFDYKPKFVVDEMCARWSDTWASCGKSSLTDADNVELLAPRGFGKTLNERIRFLLSLKYSMAALILSGQIKFAEAGSDARIMASATGWANSIGGALLVTIQCFVTVAEWVCVKLSGLVRTVDAKLSESPDWVFDIIVLLVVASLLRVFCNWCSRRELKVINSRDNHSREVIAVVGFSSLNGKQYVKLRDRDGTFDVLYDPMVVERPQLEMAMLGSTLNFSKRRPGVAALMALIDGSLQHVGMCFRFHNYLVTAGHVANALSSGIHKVALVPLVQDPTTCKCKLDPNKARLNYYEADAFSREFNLNTVHPQLDLFIKKMDDRDWSRAGIEDLKFKMNSCFNQQISTAAFRSGVLMTSTGKTSEGEDMFTLDHTATTHPGFSGSPIFCGAAVVAMHISGSADKNQAIRIEPIAHIIGKLAVNESQQDEYDENGVLVKHHGRSGSVLWDSGNFPWFKSVDGHLYQIDDEVVMRHKVAQDFVDRYLSDEDEEYDLSQDDYIGKKMAKLDRRYNATYDDECAPVLYDVIKTGRKIHISSYPEPSPLNLSILDKFSKEIIDLGFDETKYCGFVNDYASEKKSVAKHIDLYVDRMKSCVEPPSDAERERVVRYMVKACSSNRWTPFVDYNDREVIKAILDTKSFKLNKSAGLPYAQNGLATNADVHKHYGPDGLVDIVLAEWDKPFKFRLFQKIEPTKKAKVVSDMLRLIFSMPTHKLLKNIAIFKPFLMACKKGWKRSPMKYMFSPLVPGDAAHIWRVFAGKTVFECDKSNWDFNLLPWIREVVEEVVVRLIDFPTSWDEAQCVQFVRDVRGVFKEVFDNCVYVTSDGTEYHVKFSGIMKSGWYLTISINSFCQFAIHCMTAFRSGWTESDLDDDENAFGSGGDDVLQNFRKDVNVQEYLSNMNLLGVHIKEHKLLNGMEGAEFYSNVFSRVGGAVHTVPVRFTKHVYSLGLVKDEHLASALVNHMKNYCFSPKHFYLFKKMFDRLREVRPDLIGSAVFHSREWLCNEVLGVELLDKLLADKSNECDSGDE